MARYFGSFRDRLKKRSKNQPLSDQEIDWVQVATTISWSPAKRDYQWLDPEDYLSSFLKSSEEAIAPIPEPQGDGSLDLLNQGDLSGHGYSEFELLDDSLTSIDAPLPDSTKDESRYDAATDPSTQNPDDSSSNYALRPEIDVPAELPLLDEYKLELLSALQRRGVRLNVEKIRLPLELEQDLINHHEGSRSVDSYKLRARLQSFKKQVIESYESARTASHNIHIKDKLEVPHTSLQTPGDPNDGDDEDYESFILKSLNRLEASMKDQDEIAVRKEQEMEPKNPEADDTPRRPDRMGPSPSQNIQTMDSSNDSFKADPLAGTEMEGFTPLPEPPSSLADDSWLVLPIDSPAEPTSEPSEQTTDDLPPPVGISDSAQDTSPADSSLAYSADLLKALNTMSSRFPDDIYQNQTEGDDTITTFKGGEIVEPEGAKEEPEPPKNSSTNTPTIEPDPPAPPSYVHQRVQDVRSNKKKTPKKEEEAKQDEIKSTLSKDDTSLSELLLQLRNDGDQSSLHVEVNSDPIAEDRVEDKHPDTPVDDRNVIPKPDADRKRKRESGKPAKKKNDQIDIRSPFENSEEPVRKRVEPAEEPVVSGEPAESITEKPVMPDESAGTVVEDLEIPDDPFAPVVETPVIPDDPFESSVEEPIVTNEPLVESIVEVPAIPDESLSDDTIVSIEEKPEMLENPFEAVLDEPETTPEPARDATLNQPTEADVENRKEQVKVAPAKETGEPTDDLEIEEDVSSRDKLTRGEHADISPFGSPGASKLAKTPKRNEEPQAFENEERSPIESSALAEDVRSADVAQEVIPVVKEEISDSAPSDAKPEEAAVAMNDGEEGIEPVVASINTDEDAELAEMDEEFAQEIALENIVEALAFAAEEPIELKKVGRIYAEIQGVKMPTEKKLKEAIDALNSQYEETGRAFRIKLWGGGIRMVSHPQYARFIRALYEDHRPTRLSRTLMETLAIVAYSQPTTRPEVDFVRGVDSDYAIRKLLELGLIDIVGRSDTIGRPLLYGTSERFLEQFGLSQLEALPKLREVEELLGDPSFKKERLHLLALEGMDEAASAVKEEGEEPSEE